MFLLVDLQEFCSDLSVVGRKKNALKMTSGLVIFRAFFNISRTNSKTNKVNQQSELNLLFNHFPKNLDRTLTFNSVTLNNTQTEPKKYIIFSTKQITFRVGG